MESSEFHKKFINDFSSQHFSAIANYLDSFLFCPSLITTDPKTVKYLHWLALKLVEAKQLHLAETVLAVCCNGAEELSKEFAEDKIAIYNLRAQILYKLEKYVEAQAWCENLRDLALEYSGKDSSDFINALTKLALTYEATQNYSQAARLFTEALKLTGEFFKAQEQQIIWIKEKRDELLAVGELCRVCFSKSLPKANVCLSCASLSDQPLSKSGET